MKFGVSLYSFHEYAADDRLGVKGCIDKAKEMGFAGVDLVEGACKTFADKTEYLAYAKDIGDYCRKVGVEAACFCVMSDFINGCDGNTQAEIARVKDLVDVAAAYGVPIMRHDATYSTTLTFDAVLPILADAYREITAYAAEKGIRTCVENHGFFMQDAARIEKLVTAVNHPNFGVLLDIGNFADADCPIPYSVGTLAPYAIHAHAKDVHVKDGLCEDPGEGWFCTRGGNYLRGAIIGHGDIPVGGCIRALKGAGYDGYLVIEFEGLEDPLCGIRISYDNLKRFCK